MLFHQLQPHLHGIDLARPRQLVEKRLVEKAAIGIADRAPVADRNAEIDHQSFNAIVGNRIGLVEHAFGDEPIGTSGRNARQNARQKRARHRWRRDARRKHRRHSIRAGRAAEAADGHRAVHVVRHVLLARPGDLDRAALDGLGDLNGVAREIDFQPPPEAAAEKRGDDLALVRADAEFAAGEIDDHRRHLRAGPQRQLAVIEQRRGIHRLHGRVGQERHAVFRFDHVRRRRQPRLRVAIIAKGVTAFLVERGREFGEHFVGRALVGGLFPRLHHRGRGLESAPRIVGDHGEPAARRPAQVDHVDHARHFLRRTRIQSAHAGAEMRIHAHGRVQHVRLHDIDAENRRTVDFLLELDARHILADQPPLGLGLQRHAAGGASFAASAASAP